MAKIQKADNNELLTRMQNKRLTRSLLVRMQTGAGTLEDSSVVPYKTKRYSRRSPSGSHWPLCLLM